MHRSILNALPVLVLLTVGGASAGEVDYTETIKPLLREKCSTCHGALRQEAGLRLDAAQLIRRGSENGAVVAAGSAESSRLFQRVTATDELERMPPAGEGEPLNGRQLAVLKTWIDAGAPSPQEEPVPVGPQEHWAYLAPQRPVVPQPTDGQPAANPIDAFLAAAQKESGVTPFPPAEKGTLLRRVSIDLIGLPPTAGELHDFLEDESADAYERLVDRLLASPRSGERWARHWMDVWRYSDWDGFQNELRGSQRHIWRWRDWIIESLNADKGYDQMVREMLAGDELAPTDDDTLRATGFLARNYHVSNRDIWLDATVEHTAKAFLGMTINCARCHDHKYDPIAQTDYYAFRAIFEPHHVRTDRLPGRPNLIHDGLARVFDAEPDANTFLYIGGNEKHLDKEHPLPPGIPAAFGTLPPVEAIPLPLTAWFPSAKESIREEDIAAAERRLTAAERALRELVEATPELASASDSRQESLPPAPPLPRTVSLKEQLACAKVAAAAANLESLCARWSADDARYLKGDAQSADRLAIAAGRLEREAKVAEAFADVLEKRLAIEKAGAQAHDAKRKQEIDAARKKLAAAEAMLAKAREERQRRQAEAAYTPVGPSFPQSSTGRRLALAEWITDRPNPLTARVAVNHIWMRHFGEPLVANMFDFGLRSPRPQHAGLLDWLAVEFMDSGWKMKPLHRLIVTSEAYRRASSADTALAAANREIDPDNRLLWRANVRRLDAEVIRDSVLHVAGSLDTTIGGPDIDHHEGETVPRRSLYFRHAYEKQMTMLVLFDAANPTDCYRRAESIIPQQGLALTNSPLTLSESRKLARKIWSAAGKSDGLARLFVRSAFEHALSRPPSEDELATCLDFLADQRKRLSDISALTEFGGTAEAAVPAADDPAMRARENLVHVLMNHNDFVTLR
jgi:hypothetical protein